MGYNGDIVLLKSSHISPSGLSHKGKTRKSRACPSRPRFYSAPPDEPARLRQLLAPAALPLAPALARGQARPPDLPRGRPRRLIMAGRGGGCYTGRILQIGSIIFRGFGRADTQTGELCAHPTIIAIWMRKPLKRLLCPRPQELGPAGRAEGSGGVSAHLPYTSPRACYEL